MGKHEAEQVTAGGVLGVFWLCLASSAPLTVHIYPRRQLNPPDNRRPAQRTLLLSMTDSNEPFLAVLVFPKHTLASFLPRAHAPLHTLIDNPLQRCGNTQVT